MIKTAHVLATLRFPRQRDPPHSTPPLTHPPPGDVTRENPPHSTPPPAEATPVTAASGSHG